MFLITHKVRIIKCVLASQPGRETNCGTTTKAKYGGKWASPFNLFIQSSTNIYMHPQSNYADRLYQIYIGQNSTIIDNPQAKHACTKYNHT
jgi:hypothetical protein